MKAELTSLPCSPHSRCSPQSNAAQPSFSTRDSLVSGPAFPQEKLRNCCLRECWICKGAQRASDSLPGLTGIPLTRRNSGSEKGSESKTSKEENKEERRGRRKEGGKERNEYFLRLGLFVSSPHKAVREVYSLSLYGQEN